MRRGGIQIGSTAVSAIVAALVGMPAASAGKPDAHPGAGDPVYDNLYKRFDPVRFDAGDIAGARQPLEWASRNARETAVQHSARLRLARLLMEQGDADGALALTKVRDTDGFASEYEELKGDLLLAQGDRDGARRAYQAALDTLPRGSGYTRLLSMKRDNLGPEPKS